MKAAELVAQLFASGYALRVDGDKLFVRPKPDAISAERIRLAKGEIVAYVREHRPTSTHRYVLWSGARDRKSSVCLSCGLPAALHGADALTDPVILKNPNDAALIHAAAIVAGELAAELAFSAGTNR